MFLKIAPRELSIDKTPRTDMSTISATGLIASRTATGCANGANISELPKHYGWPIPLPTPRAQKANCKSCPLNASVDNTLEQIASFRTPTMTSGNNVPIGELKFRTPIGWFVARPSGNDNVYKIYAENSTDEDHLPRILSQTGQIVYQALDHSGERL